MFSIFRCMIGDCTSAGLVHFWCYVAVCQDMSRGFGIEKVLVTISFNTPVNPLLNRRVQCLPFPNLFGKFIEWVTVIP